ncbi:MULTISPECIES: SAM-dependent chlorinase/fluorinase [unclassified Iodidimonas]|nr:MULTISPECIES: SAM-dependent chlorinase/fluorinase [unclassified Iodidimonas]
MAFVMIVLFTDFGWNGPYVGQMKAVFAEQAPAVPIIDLMHDAPSFAPQPSAYLLASLIQDLPEDAIICAVVDPGVGGPRIPVLVEADGRKFIGPGNGLFELVWRRAQHHRAIMRLTRTPVRLSASFHGRDLFAPTAAALALGKPVPMAPFETPEDGAARDGSDWPDDLAQVIYIDHYGNAITGMRADKLGKASLMLGGRRLPHGRTFADHPPGMAFWYANSSGLAEIAVTKGSAARQLDLEIGTAISLTA